MEFYKPNGSHIFVPRHVEIDTPAIPVGGGVRGFYKVIRRNAMGQINYESDWKPNTVLNAGLLKLTQNNPMLYWHLGTSSQAPAVTDTGCIAPFVDSNSDGSTGVSDVRPNVVGPNYEMKHTSSKRWNPGTCTGTVRECSIGTTSSDGTTTGGTVRFLISPEVTKAADETLDVYHRMEFFPELINDDTGTFVGVHDGFDYAWTLRMQDDNFINSGANHHNARTAIRIEDQDDYWDVHTNELGAGVTGWPGTPFDNSNGSGNATLTNYTNDNTTASVDLEQLFGLNYCNGNIRTFTFRWNMLNTGYRSGYGLRVGRTGGGDEALSKDNTRVINLKIRSELTRYP